MTTNNEMGWNFDHSYTRLPDMFFERVDPTPVRSPEMVVFNEELAQSLGLDGKRLQSQEGIDILSGNQLPEGALPIAMAYAGHQFGGFTMLGDGRAVLLGEHMTSSEETLDIQLKGSGTTPYSRAGDGRATLGPMLREYIISEAMHGLGIPTNRSLSVVKTGESVRRERELPGAVLTRVAASHLRVGTFEYVSEWGSKEDLKTLADYAIHRHYPEVKEDENPYLSLYKKVIEQQAALIAKWQLVGFIHGVMNTDNMTISGETIDYGPCAFMDEFDPKTVFSSIDTQGRYAYQNQPAIGQWNLARFAEALLPLFHADQEEGVELAKEALAHFEKIYYSHWLIGMRKKLGLLNEEKQDRELIDNLLDIMKTNRADFTNTFRALTLKKVEDTPMYGTEEFTNWYKQWQERVARQEETNASIYEVMKNANPAVIPRNHRVEEALQAAVNKDDYGVMERLMNVLSNPYEYSEEQEEYATWPDPSRGPYQTFCGT
ncbi:YdiU family protein [Pontibacillus yanchengensis]|uniref:Protein nucleotidyltransferase YdiU n=2 Tax=Pontibacillus yanchengensis TaxID=462910 RepID=A0A6I4ZWF1_9BACI|nr:YdiU family protein [Pontibacillus yanchengensis]MYL32182.1 YdiU family protein [Pontibacillus yanchengensis]MYL52762.1 YdiU family protein [Pontibacillus yanchengensis]